MDIGILQLGGGECISDGNSPDINRVSRKLCKHGYFVKMSVFLADCEKTTDTFGVEFKNDFVTVLDKISEYVT